MNLHELNYPMFETTDEEKELLRKASDLLTLKNNDYFLCCVLNDFMEGTAVQDLIAKIQDKVYHTLTTYLDVYLPEEQDKVNIRKIWIEKLLNYTGETL